MKSNSYFRGVQGILLMYDVTDRRSFESIPDWIGQIRQHADAHVDMIVVGNKCDVLDEKVVSTEEGQNLAAEFGIPFWECSAKTDINVDQYIHELVEAVKDRLVADGVAEPTSNPELHLRPGLTIPTAAAPSDTQIELLMIGDSGVGKTCLLLRYANDSFSPTFITTIGIDFKIKNVEVDGTRISK